MKGHSNRLEQVEDRILELEDKIQIIGKKILVKQLKSCERKMQELSHSIKKPKLKITGIEEGEEEKAKEIHNIFNKIVKKITQILKKFCPLRYRTPPGHQTDLTKIELPHGMLSLKEQAQ
jgi:Mg2+ and Co2+ transporter CorA